MKSIVRKFIPDKQQNYENAGQSNGQSEDINKGKEPAPVDIPEGYQQEAREHMDERWSSLTRYKKHLSLYLHTIILKLIYLSD